MEGEIVFPGPTGGYWDGTGGGRVHAIDELKAAGKAVGIKGTVTFEVLRRFCDDFPFAAYELDLPTAIPCCACSCQNFAEAWAPIRAQSRDNPRPE